MTTRGTTGRILDLAEKFVAERDGVWDHDAWEALVDRVRTLGVDVDDEARRNLGNILEATRHFHRVVATMAPPSKRGRSRSKATR
jgi:hypothetical protein